VSLRQGQIESLTPLTHIPHTVILNSFQDLIEKQRGYYIYILTNYTNLTFYTGITSTLQKRIFEHRSQTKESFTQKSKTHRPQ
jgi:hypothetical protein